MAGQRRRLRRRNEGSGRDRRQSGCDPQLDHDTGRRQPVSDRGFAGGTGRSEEHTSELQSLMRISYAVFCLKKKNNKQTKTKQTSNTVSTKVDISRHTGKITRQI